MLDALSPQHLEVVHRLRHITKENLPLLVKLHNADFEHGSQEITVEHSQRSIDEEVLRASRVITGTLHHDLPLGALNLTSLVVLVCDLEW